jgi:hypothetical protein
VRLFVRVLLASAVLLISGAVWLYLVLYIGFEEMGGRSHPVLDVVAWSALVLMAAAAVVLVVEAVGAVLPLLSRRG